jgi:SagB-type dehydrogenase family enzyme
MENLRQYLKNPPVEVFENAEESDQRKGIQAPPLEKPIPEGATVIPLVPREKITLGSMSLIQAIGDRRSHRSYTDEALTLEELSYLLWATQGIREIHPRRIHAFRTVPSGGCRHPFETYLRIHKVGGVPAGLWRYSALEHALVSVWRERPEDSPSLADVCFGQQFVDKAAVSFVWTAIPYRTEWRYGPDSLKDTLLSCGHICQNLYLACASIGAGTCAIVAYDQAKLDPFLGVDGTDEIGLYVAPVGKVPTT